jgi:uncharacterized protein (TIGR02246 family)
MSDLQGIADRVEIKALPGEYSDAAMTRDYDRLASLFTPGAAVRIPGAGIQLAGREAIRAGIEQLCRTEPVPATASGDQHPPSVLSLGGSAATSG